MGIESTPLHRICGLNWRVCRVWRVSIQSLILILMLLVTLLTGATAQSEKVEITFWHVYGGVLGEQMDALVEQFNAENPTIKVNAQRVATSYAEHLERQLVALAGGVAPNVAQVDQFFIGRLAQTNSVVPIGDVLSQEEIQKVFAPFWETARYEGKIISMPLSASNIILYYNMDAFQENGLDPDRPPQTWSEYLEIGRRLTRDRSGDGEPDQWGGPVPTGGAEHTVWTWQTLLWQNGGEFLDKDNRTPRFHEDAGVEALEYWLDQLYRTPMALRTNSVTPFIHGEMMMDIRTSASISPIMAQSGFALGTAMLPRQRTSATNLGGANLVIYRSTRDKEAASIEFVRWLTGPEANLTWAITGGYVPLRPKYVQSDRYREFLKQNPLALTYIQQMPLARVRPAIPVYEDISRIVGSYLNRALNQELPARQALEQAAREVSAVIAGQHTN